MCSPSWSCGTASPSAGSYREFMNPITKSHPPKAFLRLLVNPILARLLRTPFAGAARHQFMVVTMCRCAPPAPLLLMWQMRRPRHM
jgi:hypothetical protein